MHGFRRLGAGCIYVTRNLRSLLACVIVAIGGVPLGAEAQASAPAELSVAVAASAVPVVTELARQYKDETGVDVVITPGATGNLARQVRHGAPFDVFFSADMETVEKLVAEGVVTSGSVKAYAAGKLVLWQNSDSLPRVRNAEELTSPTAKKLTVAIANPETAPYGKAARHYLENTRLLSKLGERVVIAEDVRQVLQYVDIGNADVGFVAASLLVGRSSAGITIPEDAYPAVIQGLGIIADSKQGKAAVDFCQYVLSPANDSVFTKSGYGRPPSTKKP